MSAEGRRLGIVLGVVFGLFAAMVYLYAPLVMEVDRPLAVVAIPAALIVPVAYVVEERDTLSPAVRETIAAAGMIGFALLGIAVIAGSWASKGL